MSVKIKSKYKFSIAAENAKYEGYTSEKILTSFQAHTVPIYWGNPRVSDDYNPEAFVNCNDYNNIDDVIKRVKEIDENDDLWAYMVSRPWQTEKQKKASESEHENYRKFMTNIFAQPLDTLRRMPEGTWPDMFYPEWFFKSNLISSGRILRALYDPARLARIMKRFFKPAKKLPFTDINDFFKD